MNSKKIALGIFVLIALGSAIFFYRLNSKRGATEVSEYQPIEGKIELTEAQKKDLPPSSGKGLRIIRYQNQNLWQTHLGESTQALTSALVLGELDLKPSTEVGVPVYSCAFPVGDSMNTTLDTDAKCSHEGKLMKPEAVGFVSKEIRVGFRMLVRCRSKKEGLYLSLNSHCENSDDRVDQLLGSVRSELN